MDLDDVVERWAELAAVHGAGPALPHPSLVALTLSGKTASPWSRGTLATFATSQHGGSEVPLDMSSAKCRALDARIYDEHVLATGSRPRGVTTMEAMWLATDTAAYYLTPDLRRFVRWPWEETWVAPAKLGRKRSKFVLASSGEHWTIDTGSHALSNLLAIASWAGAAD